MVGFDDDQAAQDAYMKKSKMENPALPYDEKRNEKIMKTVGGIGFPTLVLLDSEGEILHHVIPMNPPLPVEDGKPRKDKVEKDGTLEKLITDTITAAKAE